MKIIPRDKIKRYSLPLPIYKSLHIADAIGKDGSEFDVLVGLDKKYVEKLQALSRDESDTDLQNFTSDWNRFVKDTYEHWYEKSRTIFALVHKQSNDLAAVIWFGPKPLGKKSPKFGNTDEHQEAGDWHTISFRAYPKYRGRGLMKNFSQYVMGVYKMHFPHVKFWGGMDDRNGASMRLFQDLGFHVNAEYSDLPEHWLIMVRM